MRLVSAIYDDFYPFHALPMVDSCINTDNPTDLMPGDILLVWGGQDISPSLYNKKLAQQTGAGVEPGWRDRIEWALMQRAKALGIPIIGVCRGAQMLCALAGGYLIQHIDNHGSYSGHEIETVDGQVLHVNSLHHQMMYPFEVDHKLIAWSKQKLSRRYIDEDKNVDVPCEPELVYFDKVKGFALQWHPEMMDSEVPATKYLFNYIERNLNA